MQHALSSTEKAASCRRSCPVLVLTGPSGCGKSTTVKLLERSAPITLCTFPCTFAHNGTMLFCEWQLQLCVSLISAVEPLDLTHLAEELQVKLSNWEAPVGGGWESAVSARDVG